MIQGLIAWEQAAAQAEGGLMELLGQGSHGIRHLAKEGGSIGGSFPGENPVAGGQSFPQSSGLDDQASAWNQISPQAV